MVITNYATALELNIEFITYGNFYDLSIGEIIPCRNVLEIYRKSYFEKQNIDNSMFCSNPDAIFIMMNPGSSEPREYGYDIPVLTPDSLSKKIQARRLVKAKPDTTQYQVMRVMRATGWGHVRVLNLSDIREAKSNLFINKINGLNTSIHSIFSPRREMELKKALNVKYNAPIICAWGVNPGLLNLANLCIESIPENRIVGIPGKIDRLYYHPLPSLVKNQIDWLNTILKLLTPNNPISKVGG